jgi:hypothetical protein
VAGKFVKPKNMTLGLNKPWCVNKGSLPFIASFNMDIMIAPTNIKLGKDFCILEPINDISGQREWVAILYSNVV